MSHTIDPALVASKALTRARYLRDQAGDQLSRRRERRWKMKPGPLCSRRPRSQCAERERASMEERAAEGAREYRRQAGGQWTAAWARGAGADVADLDKAPSAARKIRGAARLLARRRRGAVPPREALEIVRAFPLPQTDNAAIERHLAGC